MAVNRGKGRRIGTIVKITGALIVALVVGAVAILYSFDVNEYRGFVAERVEAATGRALEIEGDVELKLSLHPRLGIAGVSFANAPWGSHPVMMRLERLEAEVSLVPLLFGEVHVDRLVLVGADILLETDKNGRGNWQLAAPAEAPSADGAPRIPSFSDILIEDLGVRFRDGATGQTVSLGLDRLEAEAESLSSPVVLAAKGTYGSQPFQAEARLGPLERLLGKGTGPYRVRLALFAGGAEARIEGALAEPLKARGVDLTIEAKGNELAELAAWGGVKMLALGAFSLAGRVKDADGGWSLGGLSARIGESDINGQASVTLGGPRPRITASLTSGRLVLDPLLGAGAAGEEAGPPADSGDGRIFPDDPLTLDALGIVDAALSLAVKTAVLGDFTLEGTSIEAKLENGRLTVKPLKLRVGGATLSGQALIDGRGKSPRVEARIGAQGLEVAELLAGTAVGDLIDGKLDVDIEVKGRGRSVRALMAGLDGHVSAVMGAGRLASRYAEYVAADLLGALLPGGSSGEAEINCAVTRFDIAKGQATAKALLFDTGRITVGGDGSIDLAEEKLDLKIVPRPKNPSLLSLATPVRVRGTLASPSFGPDEAAVVKGGAGAVIGGAINPLGLLVPLVSAGSRDKNPCVAALEAARAGPSTSPARPSAQPSAPPAATPQPEEEKKPGGLFRALGGFGKTLDKALGQEKR